MSGLSESALPAAKGLALLGRSDRPIACCPRCPEPTPLIATMVFRYNEFYCLECGGRFEFLAPSAETATPELNERHAALRAEWDEHAGSRLIVEGREPQASEEELAAHEQALAWLRGRTGKAVVAGG